MSPRRPAALLILSTGAAKSRSSVSAYPTNPARSMAATSSVSCAAAWARGSLSGQWKAAEEMERAVVVTAAPQHRLSRCHGGGDHCVTRTGQGKPDLSRCHVCHDKKERDIARTYIHTASVTGVTP